jgi:hypothetical protein
MPVETVVIYEKEIAALDDVLMHRKSSVIARPPTGGGENDDDRVAAQDGGRQGGRSRKATCACHHIIRVSRKTMQSTVIRCESCGEPFCLV